MHRSVKCGLCVAITAALGGAFSTAVWAQSAAGTSPAGGLAEVVVTATRRQEPAQRVPISITVFNQRQLENHDIVNPGDLAAYTPSLSVNEQFGSQNASFAIRGFVQDLGTAPSVGTFFAGVVEPRGPNNADTAGDMAPPGTFFDLQNVQVLKGPQGTLFGLNTTGGDVLIVPRRPTSRFGGYVQVSFGNYGMKAVQAVLNLPVSRRLKLRLGVNHESRNGYLKNTSGIGPNNFEDVDFTAVRASALLDVTDDLRNYTIFTYSRSDTNGFLDKLIACDPTLGLGSFACAQLAKEAAAHNGFYDIGQNAPASYSRLTQWQLINRTTWRVSDRLTVRNIASYAQLRDLLSESLFATNFTTPAIPGHYPSYNIDFAHPEPPPGASTANENTYTEELHLQGNGLGQRLLWQAGLYFEGSDPLGREGVQSDILGACSNVSTFQCWDPVGFLSSLQFHVPVHVASANYYEGYTSFRDYAGYGQASYKLTNELRLTGGFRYTWDHETNSNTGVAYSDFPYFPTTVDPATLTQSCSFIAVNTAAERCPTHYSLSSHAPTWLIDLDYTPTGNILAYVKYARGYRAAVINPNVGPPYNLTKPEKVDTYEIGAKTSFRSPVPVIFNVALFDNEFTDQQIQVGFVANNNAPVSPTAVPLNAGKSRIYGAEAQLTFIPFKGMTVAGGYTYLNARILSVPSFPTFSNSAYVVSGPPVAGDRLTLTPTNKATVTASYALPLNPSIGRVTVGTTYTYTSSVVTNYIDSKLVGTPFTGLSILPGYGLLDLNANWDSVAGTPIDLSLFATNVTGKQYYTFIPGLAQGTGFEVAGIGEPTMYGLRVRYRFGG